MGRFKVGSALGALAGIGLAGWLLHLYGIGRIIGLLGQAGFAGILSVTAFHGVQILFSALAWKVISGPSLPRFSLRDYMVLRWIREGVNNLLPVAQIGGEFVVARLLQGRGMALAPAIAGTVADLTLEMVTQIAFTLMGLAVLLHEGLGGGVTASVVNGVVVAALLAGAFLGAQWLGLAAAIEAGLMRLGAMVGWSGTARVQGLHEALMDCYRRPARVALAVVWQMISWLLGTLEICLAMHCLGHDVGLGAGLVIESLGQALKAMAFAVPGALGVQEGGYIVVCALFGLSPQLAIALSLMKRLREVALGVPGLVAWQRMESRQSVARARALVDAT